MSSEYSTCEADSLPLNRLASLRAAATNSRSPSVSQTRSSSERTSTIPAKVLLYTAGDAIEFMGIGRLQYVLLFAMALHAMMQGMDVTFLTVLPTLAGCSYGITDVEKALISTAYFSGVTVGALSFGFVGDRLGRKKGLIIATVWTVYISFMAIWTYNYSWLLIFRSLVGLGIGGFSLRNALMFEFLPTSFRVKSAFLVLTSWAIGTIIEVPILMIRVIRWEYIMAINHVLHLFVCACLFTLPESPRYLLKQGLIRDAREALQHVANVNNTHLPDGELVSEEDKEALLDRPIMSKKKHYNDSFRGLFQTAELRVTTILLNIIWFALFFAEYGMYFLTAELLKMSDRTSEDSNSTNLQLFGGLNTSSLRRIERSLPETHTSAIFSSFSPTSTVVAVNTTDVYPGGDPECEQFTTADYVGLALASAASFPGLLLFFFVMEWLGRKKAIALNCAGACATIALLMLPNLGRIILTVLLSLLRAVLTAAFKVLLVYTPEVYPTMLRSRGTGFQVAIGRMGTILTPFVAQVLLQESMLAGEGVYLAACLLSGCLSLLLPVETKGRALQD